MVVKIIKKGDGSIVKIPVKKVMAKTTSPVNGKKIIRKAPTLRQQKVVALIAGNSGKTKADILRAAGYSKTTIDNPNRVFNSPIVIDKVDEVAAKIARNRDRIIEALAEKDFKKENAYNLSIMMNMHTKDVELLSGRPTSREEHIIPEEEAQKIDELVDINS